MAAVRSAVRGVVPHLLTGLFRAQPGVISTVRAAEVVGAQPAAPLVLVACSGGPDSMALAAAARFVLPRQGIRVGLVTVDHGLQPGSAERAQRVAGWATEAGFAPVSVQVVSVAGRTGGPEAAAREARYAALAAAASSSDAGAVLVGHTRDDQAETVLLAAVRGAGPRGLAGMPVRRLYRGPAHGSGLPGHRVALVRPLLDVSREQTWAACRAEELPVWHDPHNADPSYRRTHARALLAALVEQLGPAVVGNLARTAHLIAADNVVLDGLARRSLRRAMVSTQPRGGLSVAALAELPDGLRTRVLHRWSALLGAARSALSHRHVAALDALVIAWRGQGPVSLPGGIHVIRREGVLLPLDG